jgi:hypothetical protein
MVSTRGGGGPTRTYTRPVAAEHAVDASIDAVTRQAAVRILIGDTSSLNAGTD